ncbi:Putative leuA leader peptide [Deinococcus deserti]|uniref:Putative leuA leader peptide n=1 Tax=Deinococcus deserti (strain DSM 17065 / CIP 109153 / LMG 22923 / VCD115) TaxID=546414 RepID=X5HN39_DEIDV|nr:putative leuA leader peptide [Deinococcus deserti VCD115]
MFVYSLLLGVPPVE